MTERGGGTNLGAGTGTLFSINTDGSDFALVHRFTGGASDGAFPRGSLTFDGSKFYGMTSGGGGSSAGVIFSINTDGSDFVLLHGFKGGVNDGRGPNGSLTLLDSTLYGMTGGGGTSNLGTLFSIGNDGSSFDLLESFAGTPADAANPDYGEMILSDDSSTLYGMTSSGGTANQGVVFARAIAPAVPEPGAFALLGFGALLLAVRRRT
jgi:uncharacterized repeat protein (TIGR03803 family)